MPINNVQQNLNHTLSSLMEEGKNNNHFLKKEIRIIYTKEVHGEIESFEKMFLTKYILQVKNDFDDIIDIMGFDKHLSKSINIFIQKLADPSEIHPSIKYNIYHELSNWLLQLKSLKKPICETIVDEVRNTLSDLEYCVSGSLIRIQQTCHKINLIKSAGLVEKLENEKNTIANDVISWFVSNNHQSISVAMEIHYVNAYKLMLNKEHNWNLASSDSDPFHGVHMKEEISELFPRLLIEINNNCQVPALIKKYGDCIYEQLVNISNKKANHVIDGTQCYLTVEGYRAIFGSPEVISLKINDWAIVEEGDIAGQYHLLPNAEGIYIALATALVDSGQATLKNEISTPDFSLMSAANIFWFLDKNSDIRSLVTLELLQQNKISGNQSSELLYFAIDNTLTEKVSYFFDTEWLIDIKDFSNNIDNEKRYKALLFCINNNIFNEKDYAESMNKFVMYALTYNDTEMVKKLITNNKKTYNINYKDLHGKTTLFYALENNISVEIIEFLLANNLDQGNEVLALDQALIASVNKKRLEVAQVLLKYGAKLMPQKHNGETALFIAIKNEDINMAKLLLEHSASADVEHVNMKGNAPLTFAVASNNLEMVKLLLSHGANINHADLNGKTALLIAIAAKYYDMAKILLENNASVHFKDRDGWDALVNSIYMDDLDLVKLIVDYKPDFYSKDQDGVPMGIWMALTQKRYDIIEFLLKNNFDVNEMISLGAERPSFPAQFIAIEANDIKIFKMFIDSGKLNLNMQTDTGKTSLLYAIEVGATEIIELLLNEKKINFNLEDASGVNALMMAASNDLGSIVVKLFEKIKSNTDETALPLKTAFFLAVESGRFDQVENYVKQDHSLIDSTQLTGKTALYIASLTGDTQMIDFLHKKCNEAGF
ncbi:ankyrin repeat domain-containing protein [Sodalis sp. RH24]|uniref:ankyrin repeat domain-containing protein n=1 Tax=unclassified Sodalis (in: enterobacteria) TaxID=2636512 RepID=UPI0039B5E4E2